MSDPRKEGRRPAWLSSVLVWAFLFLVAWRTTASIYAPRDLAVVALLYALLAVGLVAGQRTVAPAGAASRIGGILLVGVILAWHLREQTRIEGAGATLWTSQGLIQFLAPAVGLAAGFWLLEAVTNPKRDSKPSVRKPLLVWLAATIAFFLVLGIATASSNTLRWHLLRHNRMVGSLAFLLFERPVAEIEGEDWRGHQRGAPVGQPDWVHDLYRAGLQESVPAAEGEATESVAAASAPDNRPDIVFVMLDTLRADGLAAFGGDPGWMPALNDLADESLLFTDVIANSSWTRPSVASFFTGLPQEEHGALSFLFGISSGALTLAEVLGAQGYETAAFVANGVIVDQESGYRRGFEMFDYVADPPREYARADQVTDRVAGWLAANLPPAGPAGRGERPPLFLYVHYLDPHIPYMSTPQEGAEILPRSNAGIRRYYTDELRFLDAELARLMARLDGALPGSRLVLVTSDHGEEFGEHDGMGHSQTLYSEVVEIPVIVQDRTAGAAPAARLDAPLEGRDFFDLLLRSAVEGPLDVMGWAGRSARQDRFASLSFTKNPRQSRLLHALIRPYRHRIYNRLIQRGDWRLIWSAFGDTDELYDLSDDPAERRNVARSHPELVRALRAVLDTTPPYWVQPRPVDLSPEQIEDLRALGYIR